MQRLRAILPQVSAYPHTRPSRCPRCDGGILHTHGEVSKRVKDMYVDRDDYVPIPRLHCPPQIDTLYMKTHQQTTRLSRKGGALHNRPFSRQPIGWKGGPLCK